MYRLSVAVLSFLRGINAGSLELVIPHQGSLGFYLYLSLYLYLYLYITKGAWDYSYAFTFTYTSPRRPGILLVLIHLLLHILIAHQGGLGL